MVVGVAIVSAVNMVPVMVMVMVVVVVVVAAAD